MVYVYWTNTISKGQDTILLNTIVVGESDYCVQVEEGPQAMAPYLRLNYIASGSKKFNAPAQR
jgi:hypothetical protein